MNRAWNGHGTGMLWVWGLLAVAVALRVSVGVLLMWDRRQTGVTATKATPGA